MRPESQVAGFWRTLLLNFLHGQQDSECMCDSEWHCLQGVCTHSRPCLLAHRHMIISLSANLFQSTQYYDMRWSCEHLIMVWINAFVMLTTQLLPSKYCDLLHKSAAHLGKWQKLEHGSYSNAPQHM